MPNELFPPNADGRPRILIVEDEPAIADTLSFALRAEGFDSHWVSLGQQAIAVLQAEPFALVILDVGLPDLGGFDVCRRIRKSSEVPVLFLTARCDEIDRIVGLELGADDYVAKPFSPREVASRVRAILRRTRAVPASNSSPPPAPAVSVGAFAVDAAGARIAYCGQWLSLTRYEFLMLSAFLERPGRVLSRAWLMDTIWQDAEETLERTVDAHVKTLRAKLRAVRGDLEPIETHRGMGYSVRTDLS